MARAAQGALQGHALVKVGAGRGSRNLPALTWQRSQSSCNVSVRSYLVVVLDRAGRAVTNLRMLTVACKIEVFS